MPVRCGKSVSRARVFGVLDERDDTARHEARGAHHGAGPGDLVNLDHTADRGDLDAASGYRRAASLNGGRHILDIAGAIMGRG